MVCVGVGRIGLDVSLCCGSRRGCIVLVVLSACWLVYDLDAEFGEGGEVFPLVDSHAPCFEGVLLGDLHGGLFLLVCDACELVCDFLEGFVHGVIAFLCGASCGSRTHGRERTK